MTAQETTPARSAARGARFTARREARRARRGAAGPRARRRDARQAQRPTVPPVERANGWLVALAVLVGAALFTTLALRSFLSLG